MKTTKKKTAAGKTAAAKNKRTVKSSASSGRATKPAKRTKAKQSKKKTNKEKIALIEKLIIVLKKQIKKLKREKSPVRDEYRYNIDTEHMNYVYFVEKDGEKETYHSLGFTHKEFYEGKKNMPLQKNPKKGDTKPSYIRNGVIEGDRKSYSRKKAKNYQLTGDDKANAKSKIRHYKKEKKNKKIEKAHGLRSANEHTCQLNFITFRLHNYYTL